MARDGDVLLGWSGIDWKTVNKWSLCPAVELYRLLLLMMIEA